MKTLTDAVIELSRMQDGASVKEVIVQVYDKAGNKVHLHVTEIIKEGTRVIICAPAKSVHFELNLEAGE